MKIQVDCKSLSHFVHREGIALVNTKGLHCCSEQVLQSRKCKKVDYLRENQCPGACRAAHQLQLTGQNELGQDELAQDELSSCSSCGLTLSVPGGSQPRVQRKDREGSESLGKHLR